MRAGALPAGHHVVATSGVSRDSLRRAAALLPDVPLLPPDEVVAGADLALLAVPDDVLPGLVRGLAAAGSFRPGQIVVHTSGAHGIAVLAPAGPGVLPLALHPVMTFTGRPDDLARLEGVCFGVTAPDPLNVISEFSATATSSHPVMHTRTSPLPQPSLRTNMLNQNGTASRLMGVQIFCTDCHNSDDNREFGGTGPNMPQAKEQRLQNSHR